MKTRRIQYRRQNKKNTKRKGKRTGGGKRKVKKSNKGNQHKLKEIYNNEAN